MAGVNKGGDPWTQVLQVKEKMQIPKGAILTQDGPLGRQRPEPEIIEHMLDDLESRMRHYFLLYNRERDLRKRAEEDAYRLEQEIAQLQQDIQQSVAKGKSLESKIKTLVGQPLKIKETVDKIDLLYTQMDTLIQSLVGIGSCATIQSTSREAFVKLCLEYLYPCRDLDSRINCLYTALYGMLMNTTIQVQPPKPSSPALETPRTNALVGISLRIHHVLLLSQPPSVSGFTCVFRYDHEDALAAKSDSTRCITTSAKPLDIASHVLDFNQTISISSLPPKIPNVIPNLVVDLYAQDSLMATSSMSIVDQKTLHPDEPWQLKSPQGTDFGNITITVSPVPNGAKLPAVGFAPKEPESTRAPAPQVQSPKKEPATTTPSQTTQAKAVGPFTPKGAQNVRRPIILKKAANAKSSKIAKLASLFGAKANAIPEAEPVAATSIEKLDSGPAMTKAPSAATLPQEHEEPMQPQEPQEHAEQTESTKPVEPSSPKEPLAKEAPSSPPKVPKEPSVQAPNEAENVKEDQEDTKPATTEQTLQRIMTRSLSKIKEKAPVPIKAKPALGKIQPQPQIPQQKAPATPKGPLVPIIIAPKILKKPPSFKKGPI
ncbi:hypothetical protein BdWA1_001820 [Babesia duncani]|uniref:Uncharacterized protein n=1 Tax=Babesia duncani TaxID=323732 RepID=A0AAD9PLI8_9APIC|nr:hypothetical protein BdWA1_001820 [Babesia duncani]